MRRWRELSLIGFLLLTLSASTGRTALRPEEGEPQRKKPEYPIVDYNAPEPADPQERARRRKKGEKYNNEPFPINPSRKNLLSNTVEHFPYDTPALPVTRSAAVIVGTVTQAKAYLSPDKSYVYSEFDVLVGEVIKDDAQSPLGIGQSVPVERPGGRVRVAPGNIHEYRTTLNPLEVGGRYALFLIRRGDDYTVFTGYKLEAGKVLPVDDYFKSLEGTSEEDFMRDLRRAAAAPRKETGQSAVDTSPTAAMLYDEPPEPVPDPGDCQLPAPPPCVKPQTTNSPNSHRAPSKSLTTQTTSTPTRYRPSEMATWHGTAWAV